MLKKRQKSYVSAFLAFAVLAASPIALTSVAHAEDQTTITPIAVVAKAPTLSQDDAVKKARDLLGLTEDKWSVSQITVRTGQDPSNNINAHPSFELDFNQANSDAPNGYHAVIDGITGRLLSMSHINKFAVDKGESTTESKQAIAEAFLQKVAPDEFKQSELLPNPYQVTDMSSWQNYTYVRKVNGLPVIGNQIQVFVGIDGQVESYNLNWSDATFTAPDNSNIDMTQANQVYQQTLAMRLSYANYYAGDGSAPSVKLVYQPAYKPFNQYGGGVGQIIQPVIDAKTGKTFDAYGQPTTDVNQPVPVPLVPNGPTTPSALDHELTQAEAETLATKSGLVPNDATLTDSSYQTMYGNKVWNFSYQAKNADENQIYYTVSFNVKTGEITNYYGEKEVALSSQALLSDDQLLQKATDLVKQLYPGRLGAICAPTRSVVMKSNSFFQFPLLKNGVPTEEAISVSLNPATGSLMNMSINGSNQNFDTTDYPSTDEVVSADQAKSVYMKKRPLELAYIFPMSNDGTGSTTPVLVYTPATSLYNNSSVVDAKTGDWIDMSPNNKPNPTPTDIKGHWAENVLAQFAQRGLLEMDGNQAHPDQQLTRAQFVRLLVDFKQVGDLSYAIPPTFSDVPKDSKYYKQIETAVVEKWITKTDSFNPNAKITREEAAAILARAQGFSDLAKHKEIFTLPYRDADSISSWAYGSVAIDYGLGLMKGVDTTHFAPQATLTLAQAATMLNQIHDPQP